MTADGAAGGEGDEWVETHAGRKHSHGVNGPGEIDDIPDADDGPTGVATGAMAGMSLSDSQAPPAEIPDMDEIPDMEEEIEGEEDEATAAPVKPSVVSKDTRYFFLLRIILGPLTTHYH